MSSRPQPPPDDQSGNVVTGFVFGLLDRLFKDNATGEVLAGRVVTVIAIFAMFIIWNKSEVLLQLYKDSSFETYTQIVQQQKEKKFDAVVQEQLQIVHVSTGADFSAIYTFRPKNLNYFVDLSLYEGKLPDSLDAKNLGGYPIDKTSPEYSAHLSGEPYETTTDFTYLPTQLTKKDVKYMYSCPYFNMDNVYSGTISMYWFNEPLVSKKRLFAVCNQAARVIGRVK